MARNVTTFQPGKSGNPGGRPAILNRIKELARKFDEISINTLAEIVQDGGVDPRARVAACCALLDRGYGKPGQTIELDAKHQFAGEDIVVVTSATKPLLLAGE